MITSSPFVLRLGRLAGLLACGLAAGCSSGKSDSFVAAGGGDGGGDPVPPVTVTGFFGGRVRADLNRNGVIEPNEPGVPDVRVFVVDFEGLQRTAVTDAGGAYQLEAPVLAGDSYAITVDLATLPPGLELSPLLSGENGVLVVDVPADAVGESVRTGLDFGFAARVDAGVIGDFVWHDVNCDGIQDAGEPGLDDVRVVLRDAQGALLAETLTAPSEFGMSGHYRFEGLLPAVNYIVEVDPATWPIGFVPGPCDLAGADAALDSNCSPAIVELGLTDLGIDFGFCSGGNGVIGDRVFRDADADGVQDADEVGLDGVTVWLRDVSGAVIRTMKTKTIAGPGFYRFTGLSAGTYTVEVDSDSLPSGCVASPVGSGGDPALDSNGSPAVVVLATDDSVDETIDFGYVCDFTASVGDFVFHDVDGDGLQDQGEPGLAGVKVVLSDVYGNQLGTVFTASDGSYNFAALPEGDYVVEVDTATLPAGATASPCEVGQDPEVDSNCTPAAVTLVFGQKERTIDFGFVLPNGGSVGDFVWHDYDCDGLQDPGEPGIAGVLVRLRDANGTVIAMQTTDANGNYAFVGLAPGDYLVDVNPNSLPDDFEPTFCELGDDDEVDSNCMPAAVTVPAGGGHCQSIDFGYIEH